MQFEGINTIRRTNVSIMHHRQGSAMPIRRFTKTSHLMPDILLWTYQALQGERAGQPGEVGGKHYLIKLYALIDKAEANRFS